MAVRSPRLFGRTSRAALLGAWTALVPALSLAQPAAPPPEASPPAGEAAPTAAPPSQVVDLPAQAVGASGPARPPPSTPARPKVDPNAKPDTRGAALRAYQDALAAQKVGATGPLSRDRVREALADAELEISLGRRDEAIGDLAYLVESPRFTAFAALDEGRNAMFLLGDALGRSGAHDPARAYLVSLLDKTPLDLWGRRAAKSLVDFGLSSDRPRVFLDDLQKVRASAPEELSSDIAYLAGRTAERGGKAKYDAAIAEYAKVSPRSRFWAQATYLSGLLRVEQKRLKEGEQLFCKVADVKQTPRAALAFGGGDFFEVRDLARLGLGRVAHEQLRFDDARYYYYLVPSDSARIQEALYESANSRYEAKDYRGARDLLDEMRARGEASPYDDEVWVFDAYVDLALCRFPSADAKLKEFLERYEPVRDAARRVLKDEQALTDLVEAVQRGSDPATLGVRGEEAPLRALGSLLRADVDFGHATRRLSELDQQASGLRRATGELDDVKEKLASPKEVKPRAEGRLGATVSERAEKLDAQLSEVRRLIRQVKATGEQAALVQQLEGQLKELEARARDAAREERRGAAPAVAQGGVAALVEKDREQATSLFAEVEAVRTELLALQQAAAKGSLERFDRRLSRLVRRARLGRIETVLGKKRALEVEIEALAEGYLPDGAVDSLAAARYLRDDEEYWPYDGEDWADEYVGGEGLR